MMLAGVDPMALFAKYRDRFWSFHLKDAKADRSGDTELGKGTFDFRRFLAAIPDLEHKPCYVEQEEARDPLTSARSNRAYLRGLDF
jgi:sugar phosphate isomerase/epimerase